MLYGDEFLLAVRVLGKSLRNTGTDRELVCIVTAASEGSIETLKKDGWTVYMVDTILSPSESAGYVTPPRFWAVFTKLIIFRMPYKKLVYLDADTLVLSNMDELFQCGGERGFCANLKHSEHFNSGVLVVSPVKELFEDMLTKLQYMPSYEGADQGFLNSYFSSFADAPVFMYHGDEGKVKDLKPTVVTDKVSLILQRLPTRYNSDVGLYIFNSEKWSIPAETVKLIHYTLGPVKPWDWWSSWLMKPAKLWRAVRVQLEQEAGEPGSWNRGLVLFAIPLVLGFIHYLWMSSSKNQKGLFKTFSEKYGLVDWGCLFISQHLNELSILLGFISLALAFLVPAVFVIPRHLSPTWGWLLVYEWGFFWAGLATYHWLLLCYRVGEHRQEADLNFQYSVAGKHVHEAHPRAALMRKTVPFLLALVALLLVVPSVPVLVSQFAVRLVVLGVGIAVGVIALTYSYITLGNMWYSFGSISSRQKGREARSLGLQEL